MPILNQFSRASFHPLTNRKHHCRLCGRIICALPVKAPQRLAPCSLLFVVDSHTRQIEEVNEGVDYGVKKKRVNPKEKASQDDPEKFLRGVRICRECRPTLLYALSFLFLEIKPYELRGDCSISRRLRSRLLL